MATTDADTSGTVVQAWLRTRLTRSCGSTEAERRSLSSTIRLAIEDKLRADEERRPWYGPVLSPGPEGASEAQSTVGGLQTEAGAPGREGDGGRLKAVSSADRRLARREKKS